MALMGKDIVVDALELTPSAKGQLLAKIINLVTDGASLYQQARIEAFIAGYFHAERSVSEKDVNMLINLMKNDQNSSLIQGMFESVLRANSQISILLMGHLWGITNRENRKLSPQELILSCALTQLNDYDFYVFLSIMKMRSSGNDGYIDADKMDHIPEASLVLQKLCNLQILSVVDSYVEEETLVMGPHYYINDIAELLNEWLEQNMSIINYYGWLVVFDT